MNIFLIFFICVIILAVFLYVRMTKERYTKYFGDLKYMSPSQILALSDVDKQHLQDITIDQYNSLDRVQREALEKTMGFSPADFDHCGHFKPS